MADEYAVPRSVFQAKFEPPFGPSNPFIPRLILFCGRYKAAIPKNLASTLDRCISKELTDLFQPKYKDFLAQHITAEDWDRKFRKRFLWQNGLLPKRVVRNHIRPALIRRAPCLLVRLGGRRNA